MDYKENFKKVLRIHKSLLLYDLPDDIIPLIYEYLGDLDENIIDMYNNHCFYGIYHCGDEDYKYVIGHWCNICKLHLQLRTEKSLNRHIISQNHNYHLRKYHKRKADRNIQKYKNEIKNTSVYKWFAINTNKKIKQKFKNNLKVEPITYKFQDYRKSK